MCIIPQPGVIATDSFTIATADFREFILETGAVLGISVIAGLLTNAQFAPVTPHPGITSRVLISLTTSAQLDEDSLIQIELPPGDYGAGVPNLSVVVNSPAGVTAIASWDTHFSALLILISTSTPVPQESSVSFTVTALRMPSSIRDQTTSAIIHTWNAAGLQLDGPDATTIQAVTAVQNLPSVWKTANPRPGITSNIVLTFDTNGAIPVGGQVFVTLPTSGFSAKGGPLTVTLTSLTTGAVTIASALWDTPSLSIILTLGGATGIAAYTTSVTLSISALDTPISVRYGSRIGAFLTTTDQSGGVIDGPSAVTMDAIVAGLVLGTRIWVSAKPFAGVVSSQTVTFFNSGRLAGGSSIEIVMPDVKWSMATSDTATVSTPALGATPAAMTWDAATRKLSVVLSTSIATITVSSIISIQIPNVSNPPKETGVCNAFLTTRAIDGLIIDGPASISVMDIARGSVSGAMTWSSTTTASASMQSDQVLRVTLSGALPSGSFLIITLPVGGWRFLSSVPNAVFLLPMTGLSVNSISWTLASGELRIETLGDLNEGAAIEVLAKDMINPYSEQPSAALTLVTTLADSGVVDESTSGISMNAIMSSALPQSGTWRSSVATPGVESTQTIALSIGGRLEAGASVCFSLANADGWLVSFASVATLSIAPSAGVEMVMSWNVPTRELCIVVPSAIAQESSMELQVTRVRSPPSIRSQQTADVSIRSHLGGLVNTGSVLLNAITKGALTGALLWQSLLFSPGPVAGLLTSATLSFQSTGRILPGGTISLTLPTGWRLEPSACSAMFKQPIVVGIATCLDNVLTITMSDIVDQYTDVEILVSGVRNPGIVLPPGVAAMQTIASDGGFIDDSFSVVTGAIESALIDIVSSGDARTAVVGVKKAFGFQGFNVAQGDVIKFVDASTASDANCGEAVTGISDAGGLIILAVSSSVTIQPTFTQASIDGQSFAICYKFGSNPFKLYPDLGFTVKEITSVSSNVGVSSMTVSDYAKIWKFTGRGISTGDQVRWINIKEIQNALLGSSSSQPDCTDIATLAKLTPLPGVSLDVQEDAYTRNIALPMGQASLAFDKQNAGKVFCLCYKFGNEPFAVYPAITVQVNHLELIKATTAGHDAVAVVDATKLFTFIGQGLMLNDRVYFVEAGTTTNCAASSTNPALRADHMLTAQLQTILFISESLDTGVSFTAAAAGTRVLPCYQFGAEPYQMYPTILLEVKMVARFLGNLGSSLLAVATVPEPLTFVGYGLEPDDQVRWILHGEEDCESNLANLIAFDTDSLDPIDTVTLDATQSGVFNFTDAQLDYNPLLCYKFGDEVFKLYTTLSITISTVWSKTSLSGEKDVAVVAARKGFTLYGMNLAEGDRVGWTSTPLTTQCADLSLLLANAANLDNEYISYTTSHSEVGVSVAHINSGKRVYLCYGFGSEPLKLYANLYLDVKSILNMRSLLGSSDAAVSGALKTFLFDGDGVTTGDFAKFVPGTDLNCNAPGISLTNIMKEFDDYAEMAMYLYENIVGVTVGSFKFGSDGNSAGLNRVLCYRFGIEPFFFYEYFHIDVKTIWTLTQFDRTVGGQDDVAVVNENKLVVIDGVGVSEKDQAKFVDQSALSDQDCADFPAQGLFSQKITVFKNATMWYPFESSSNGTEWKLCYKFDDEPYRLYPSVGVEVKQILDLWDFNAFTSNNHNNVNNSLLGKVATIGQVKAWLPVGSGIQQGDTVKFVSQSVQSSSDCGEPNSNIAGGSTVMQVIIATGSSLKSLVFLGTFTEFPSSPSDLYHLCYKFQNEPFSYIRGLELRTYGVLSIDRSTFLAEASTPIQLSGFRLGDTDQLGWTASGSTNCSNVFAITDVVDQKTIVWFPKAFYKLCLCYSFDRQPFALFPKISVSVAQAEIWVPTTTSVVADQQVQMTVAGTFGLTVSNDQIAWVPADAIACAADLLTTYADVMATSVVSTTQSVTPIARGGSAIFTVKFVAPVSSNTGALGAGSSLATWKLCYRFGNMAEFLMFSDVLCDVLNIEQVQLLQAEPADLGSMMTFEFEGVGTQDFDAAKWVVAGDASVDSDCDALPAVGGSLTSFVINKLASYTFVQATARMALCYKFQNHAFKLFAAIPIKDSSSSSSIKTSSSSKTSTSSTGSSQSSSPLVQFDDEREAAMSGALTPNRDIATVSLKLDMDINTLPAGSPAETQFKASLTTTLSASLGIDAARIQILELVEGSVIVKFQLLPSENVADLLVHEAIQDLQSQLDDPKSDLMKSGVVVLGNGDATSALSVSITSPLTAAAASMSIQALGYQRNGLFTFVRGVYSVTENTPTLIVPVVRLQGTDSIITLIVNLDPLKRTAAYNQDYLIPMALENDPTSLFLRFEIGEALQFIEITILDDTVNERHFEYLTLTLTDPGTPGAALGGTQETVIRMFDYGDGNELVRHSFTTSAMGAKKSSDDPLKGWRVVENGDNVLRVAAKGIFAVDAVFGESEYDQQCDLASPTGECTFACGVGGDLSSVLHTPMSERNVLALASGDYVVSQSAVTTFPTEVGSLVRYPGLEMVLRLTLLLLVYLGILVVVLGENESAAPERLPCVLFCYQHCGPADPTGALQPVESRVVSQLKGQK